MVRPRRVVAGAALATAAVASAAGTAAGHVDYVTDGSGSPLDGLAFLIEVLSSPTNAAIVGVGTLAVLLAVAGYARVLAPIQDLQVLAGRLDDYHDLVPWMLRLAVGLPLVGAGFGGYLFAPGIEFQPATAGLARVALVGIGFFILFGLATRIVATCGLLVYVGTLFANPEAILAVEYVPGFLAIAILGGGRPSADDMLQEVAATDGTLYGRVDPVHHLKAWLDAKTRPLVAYVPLVLRVGVGVAFIYLGLTQKLADPGRALLVVEKYNLTAIVPVDPGLWVVGAGLVEMAVGAALLVGLFTRASAATAFLMLTLTLFGLPDDPVLAHVTLFGMTSAIFTLGAGPYAIDGWLRGDEETPTAGTAAGSEPP